MVVKKKPAAARKRKLVSKKSSIRISPQQTKMARFPLWITTPLYTLKQRSSSFLSRRPHRSFQRTRRRDYVRTLQMPGYISFTRYVFMQLWRHRKTFVLLAVLYAILNAVLVGLGSQDTYTQLSAVLHKTGANIFSGGFGQAGSAGLLVLASIGGGLSSASATDAQKIFGFLLALMLWLVVVWLLRAYLSGDRPRLRDGLYSSGSPLLGLFCVALFGVIQLIPLALAVLGFTAASGYGLFDGGVPAMLFWIVAALLVSLSLYWITSTFFAMVIVTLPGMYPFQAIKSAGDMVIGRRLRVLFRLLWMGLTVVIAWAIIVVPIALVTNLLVGAWKQLSWVPVVPFTLLIMSTLTLIWVSGYVYLLYRKVVDDDAAPA